MEVCNFFEAKNCQIFKIVYPTDWLSARNYQDMVIAQLIMIIIHITCSIFLTNKYMENNWMALGRARQMEKKKHVRMCACERTTYIQY